MAKEAESTRDVLDFWNSRATLGQLAGTRDLIAKQLEIAALLELVQDGMRVLEVGCGNGITAIEVSRRHAVHLLAIDFAEEMIAAGVRAYVTCLDPRKVGRELAGRAFDLDLLADLPPEADPLGENGEFHTFAWDGPGFAQPVYVTVGETVERDGFVFTDLLPDRRPPA